MIALPPSVEQLIFETLKSSPIALTIEEVAQQTQVHRITASKYLAVLEARGTIQRRNVGKAKLFSLITKQGSVAQ